MEAQTIIAKRIAQELRSGMLINLGIGIPTLVANYVPPGVNVFFQSENGLIGTGPIPEEGMAHPTLRMPPGIPSAHFLAQAPSTVRCPLVSSVVDIST